MLRFGTCVESVCQAYWRLRWEGCAGNGLMSLIVKNHRRLGLGGTVLVVLVESRVILEIEIELTELANNSLYCRRGICA
jgi:hypothetical protein